MEKKNQDFILFNIGILSHRTCIGLEKKSKIKNTRKCDKYFQCEYLIIYHSYNIFNI